MSVLFPIAVDAQAALEAPRGRAARESDARLLIGAEVAFVRELTGPVYETRAAAEAAQASRVDVEGQPGVQPEDRYCELVETSSAPVKGRKSKGRTIGGGQAEPVFEAGHRWPKPRRLLKTVWRLSVAYWRIVEHPTPATLPQARTARRSGEALDPRALKAMAEQPLKPVTPQRSLDIGLFEVRLPDAPHLIIPDE